MFDQHAALTIEAAQQPDAYVIHIEGELDLSGCPELDLALAAAEQTQARSRGATFIDTSGLASLMKASRRSASNGSRLQITRGTGQPAELFRMTGFDKVVPLTHPAMCPAIRGTGPTAGSWVHASSSPHRDHREPVN